MAEAGLDHVQISIQDSRAASADRIAGYQGAYARKNALAAEVVRLGLPLTINMVVHRANIERIEEMVEQALRSAPAASRSPMCSITAGRSKNRAALMPTREQVERAVEMVETLREPASRPYRHRRRGARLLCPLPQALRRRLGTPLAQRHAVGPRAALPRGRDAFPGLEFWSVREHPLQAIWESSPAFNAFRGTDWMPEPCASCPRREQDFGGCRCQAFLLTGDARATDPVCHLAPNMRVVEQLAAVREDMPYSYRHS